MLPITRTEPQAAPPPHAVKTRGAETAHAEHFAQTMQRATDGDARREVVSPQKEANEDAVAQGKDADAAGSTESGETPRDGVGEAARHDGSHEAATAVAAKIGLKNGGTHGSAKEAKHSKAQANLKDAVEGAVVEGTELQDAAGSGVNGASVVPATEKTADAERVVDATGLDKNRGAVLRLDAVAGAANGEHKADPANVAEHKDVVADTSSERLTSAGAGKLP